MTEARADDPAARPEPAEPSLGGANWRTMMATFVTRLERDHEALIEALRERLDASEGQQRRLEARVAALEEALEGLRLRRLGAVEAAPVPVPGPGAEAHAAGEVATSSLAMSASTDAAGGRDEPAVADALAAPAAAPAPAPAPAALAGVGPDATAQGEGMVALPAAVAAGPVGAPSPPSAAEPLSAGAGSGAPGPASAPWQEAARTMLAREAEVLRRAAAGEAPVDIAAALGRGVGEVQLVLRLARRVGLEPTSQTVRTGLEEGF